MPDVTVQAAGLATLALAPANPGRPVVLIDGRSGSGKTTLGASLAALVPGAQLVGLDDVYPGWGGLEAASETVVTGILRPSSPGYRRWDWEAGTPSGWRALSADAPLIVEGAGALTLASAALATLCIWVELDELTRRQRVRGRADAEAYWPWWEMWARQEAVHIARNRPRSLADVVVEG